MLILITRWEEATQQHECSGQNDDPDAEVAGIQRLPTKRDSRRGHECQENRPARQDDVLSEIPELSPQGHRLVNARVCRIQKTEAREFEVSEKERLRHGRKEIERRGKRGGGS